MALNTTIKRLLLRVTRSLRFMLSDKLFIRILYRLYMGKSLDLKNPRTMNEKLQWIKLYDRKPIYHTMVDKLLAKEYYAQLIGKEHIIPTLGVWERFDDIDFDKLPDSFVLKTNHSGGNTGVVICRDKRALDKAKAKAALEKSLKTDIYKSFGEWPYKGIKKYIFAEELIGNADEELVDYKFYCFDGYVDAVLMCIDRQIGDPKFYFFDKRWELKRYNKRGKQAPEGFTLPRPKNMEQMFDLASKISQGIPHLRVDLYNVDGKIYFGEATFFTASGFDANRLPEADLYFGGLINLDAVRDSDK
ncbi:MAG: glycosyl transferase [Alistipes sp.]|nr:glycosyl transferase [Alistipes sp.]